MHGLAFPDLQDGAVDVVDQLVHNSSRHGADFIAGAGMRTTKAVSSWRTMTQPPRMSIQGEGRRDALWSRRHAASTHPFRHRGAEIGLDRPFPQTEVRGDLHSSIPGRRRPGHPSRAGRGGRRGAGRSWSSAGRLRRGSAVGARPAPAARGCRRRRRSRRCCGARRSSPQLLALCRRDRCGCRRCGAEAPLHLVADAQLVSDGLGDLHGRGRGHAADPLLRPRAGIEHAARAALTTIGRASRVRRPSPRTKTS